MFDRRRTRRPRLPHGNVPSHERRFRTVERFPPRSTKPPGKRHQVAGLAHPAAAASFAARRVRTQDRPLHDAEHRRRRGGRPATLAPGGRHVRSTAAGANPLVIGSARISSCPRTREAWRGVRPPTRSLFGRTATSTRPKLLARAHRVGRNGASVTPRICAGHAVRRVPPMGAEARSAAVAWW